MADWRNAEAGGFEFANKKQKQHKFMLGDKVRFIGGGPELTVVYADGNITRCGWFDKKDTFNQCEFSNDLVRKVGEPFEGCGIGEGQA